MSFIWNAVSSTKCWAGKQTHEAEGIRTRWRSVDSNEEMANISRYGNRWWWRVYRKKLFNESLRVSRWSKRTRRSITGLYLTLYLMTRKLSRILYNFRNRRCHFYKRLFNVKLWTMEKALTILSVFRYFFSSCSRIWHSWSIDPISSLGCFIFYKFVVELSTA